MRTQTSSLLTLLRVDQVYTPDPSDAREILMAGGRIAALGRNLPAPAELGVQVVDLPGTIAVPAFIDQHVHVTGGGGEGGPTTRCPEIGVEEIARAGVGTVVGVLGTDSVSRSPADLLAKTRALNEEGISAFMYTGAYRVPPPTLTGDVQRDLAWIPEVLGVGEIAISDHRSAQPTQEQLERLVADARVGAMLAGKRGICHFHVGSGDRGLEPLRTLLRRTEIPADQVIPTHVNRNRRLLGEAAEYAVEFGAAVDVTTFDSPGNQVLSAAEAVLALLEAGVPLARMTMSSDSNGSLPDFNEKGEYVGMRVASIGALLNDWRRLATSGRLDLPDALAVLTRNVARVLGLEGVKGTLAPGADADVTVLDASLNPVALFALGRQRL